MAENLPQVRQSNLPFALSCAAGASRQNATQCVRAFQRKVSQREVSPGLTPLKKCQTETWFSKGRILPSTFVLPVLPNDVGVPVCAFVPNHPNIKLCALPAQYPKLARHLEGLASLLVSLLASVLASVLASLLASVRAGGWHRLNRSSPACSDMRNGQTAAHAGARLPPPPGGNLRHTHSSCRWRHCSTGPTLPASLVPFVRARCTSSEPRTYCTSPRRP